MSKVVFTWFCFADKNQMASSGDLSFSDVMSVAKAIDLSYFAYPWTVAQWDDFLSDPTYYAIGLMTKNQMEPVSLILYHLAPADHTVHLLKLVTVPEYRRKSFAAELLRISLEKFQKLGKENVFLEVETSNRPAIAFYQKWGFQQLHIKKNFYGANRDALSMLAPLLHIS